MDFFINLQSGEIAPDYTDENTILYNNDCMKILQQIPDNTIDLICTDPPYRITSRWWWGNKKWKKIL